MKKNIIVTIAVVLGFLALSYGFVPDLLSGKIVNQSDISGWQGASRELMTWNAAHPDNPAKWTESMFGGMPTTTIQSYTKGDWTQSVYDFLLTGKRPATYLFISLLGAWLMMLAFGTRPLIAVAGAIAVTFCSYNLQIIQVGHNTKMQALSFLPWVLAALVFTYRSALNGNYGKKRWLLYSVFGAALFAFVLSFQIKANHQQISYYLAGMILLYVITLVIWLAAHKERRSLFGRFFAASALLLVLGLSGIATNASKLLPTMEYTPYSMRGGSSSVAEGQDGSQGLKLDYATAWSYGWGELPNLFIPDFNGGSSAGAVNPDKSATIDLLKRAGQPNIREVAKSLPLYWGPQPFTAGPMYMGAVTIFLFILGLLLYRGKEKWWIVVSGIIAVFLALGCNFMWFTKLFYDYVPLYNKFRTVSMALVVLQFTLPILACIICDRVLHSPDYASAFRSKGWIALAVSGGFCLLCVLVPDIAGSFTGAVDVGQPDILVDALVQDRRSLMVADSWRSLLFVAAAWTVLFWSSRSTQNCRNAVIASSLICVLMIADLCPVGKRYLNSSHFVTPRAFNNQFALRPVDEIILEDDDPSYRVLDLTVNIFNDSHPSYWHKNIGGYSPAKMQIYQEYIENHLQGDISAVQRAINDAIKTAGTVDEVSSALPYREGLAKLNCRYIIIDGKLPPLIYPHAAGNAWFESAEGEIKMSSYTPDALEYVYDSETGGKAVFSEVYYPAGWRAFLDDGTELPISQSDEIFRSLDLPAGRHTLTMSFSPRSYSAGYIVSLSFSIVLVLAAAVSSVLMFLKRKEWK